MSSRYIQILVLSLVAILLGACTTTYTRDGQGVPADFAEASLADSEPIDVEKKRIESAVAAVEVERGANLLRNLQWLIAQKDLAVPYVAERLKNTNIRTKASLLYVLGFTRTAESTAALASHMNHGDAIVRYEAAAGLLNQGDMTAVPVLVDMLNSPDRRFRFKAIQVLEANTGHHFNYQFSADKETRQAAINKWQKWWDQEKKRLMYRPVSSN